MPTIPTVSTAPPRRFIRAIAVALALAIIGFFAVVARAAPATLKPFGDQAELDAWLAPWVEAAKRQRAARSAAMDSMMSFSPQPAPAPAPATAGAAAPAAKAAESVTNTQTAGVDEGGIVKLHGKHLVVLRRGRLFTVDIDGRRLDAMAAVPAFGGSVNPGGTWYDEMLIWRDTVAVIGYSYQRGGTEVGVFDLLPDGGIRHRATYHLRSNDYYSSRNYASRLIGSKLVFYTPLYMNAARPLPDQLPAQRHWTPGAAPNPSDFKPIVGVQKIYRGLDSVEPGESIAMHSVTTCDLARPQLDCESTALIARAGRVFYVSADAVYVWTAGTSRRNDGRSDGRNDGRARGATLYRLPLDGRAPAALNTTGAPIDQFSFLEGADGYLNVMLRATGTGEAMWGAESNAGGELALMRVPLASFGDLQASAPASAYRPLPAAGPGSLQNRFVGDHLIYGAGAGWRRPAASAIAYQVQAVRYARNESVHRLKLDHAVDRIEPMGADAVIVGSAKSETGGSLGFTSLKLAAGEPSIGGAYQRADAAQGETRSHGFFYKPENADAGVIGLPVIGGNEAASRQLRRPAASMLYLRHQSSSFSELGTLDARAGDAPRDACLASCVDWYGNSRPLFVGGRVFALMGYEIIEGRIADGRIQELRRIDFTPRAAVLERSP